MRPSPPVSSLWGSRAVTWIDEKNTIPRRASWILKSVVDKRTEAQLMFEIAFFFARPSAAKFLPNRMT